MGREKATALMKPDWIKAMTRGTDLAFEIGSFVSAGRGRVGDLGRGVVGIVFVCVCGGGGGGGNWRWGGGGGRLVLLNLVSSAL